MLQQWYNGIKLYLIVYLGTPKPTTPKSNVRVEEDCPYEMECDGMSMPPKTK